MASVFTKSSTFSRFNLSESESDIHVFIREYKERILKGLIAQESPISPFVSFADRGGFPAPSEKWIQNNYERFFSDTENEIVARINYLKQMGSICSIAYSRDGDHLVVGHDTGLIQKYTDTANCSEFNNKSAKIWYPMYSQLKPRKANIDWVQENHDKFLKDTRNEILYHRWYLSQCGYITAIIYSVDGRYIIVGHSTGLISMRHGQTGVVLCTLRYIQFPPKPIYSIEYSKTEDRVCYAACTDGVIYRITVPDIDVTVEAEDCIRADPALEGLNTQYYVSPGVSAYSTPFISQRFPSLCLGIAKDNSKMVVGYGDTSVKVYDMETQMSLTTYKVHKLRLQFIPKKLQRIHFGSVCALSCHNHNSNIFATGSWDKTLRVWDVRCPVGCMMTFEGVNIIHNSIDLNREHCISGSWQTTEALSVWDISARKRLNVIRVQNRRPDVDGEYIYACRYWRSSKYNRKGKYAIIGGSGTNCVEVINLHNRYIACSYPAAGTILAIDSHEDRIAFGGTAPVFTIVTFHDPKHEKVVAEEDSDYDYTKADIFYDTQPSVSSADEEKEKKSKASKVAS